MNCDDDDDEEDDDGLMDIDNDGSSDEQMIHFEDDQFTTSFEIEMDLNKVTVCFYCCYYVCLFVEEMVC